MKLKLVSAACLALCSMSSFAVTVSSCPATPTAADLVNKCTPDVTFYMGGASAQAGALTTAILTPGLIFDEAKPFAKVRLTSTGISGGGVAGASVDPAAVTTTGKDGNTIAFVGYGVGANATKRVAVIYNKANGSFAGVNQLLVPKTAELENVTLQLVTATQQKTAGFTGNTCATSNTTADTVAPTLGTKIGYSTYECANAVAFATGWGGDKQKAMHLALSDVRPSEATPGINGGLMAKWKNSAFPAVATGMQGFGVIVSPSLYTAMIAKEVAAGHLAASCLTTQTVGGATDVITAACQPNLPTAAYTSLVTGKATSAAAFLGNSDVAGTTVLLARRGDSSGTQAAANIFFANQAATAAKAALQATDNAPSVAKVGVVGDVTVVENVGTGDVITAVSAAAGYAIGVVSLENTYAFAKASSKVKGALFVKIDGISPNLTENSAGATVLDGKARVGMLSGYPFVYEMQALTSTKLADPYKAIATSITTALQNPAANLAGIAYIGSGTPAVNTPFLRAASNYAPLSK